MNEHEDPFIESLEAWFRDAITSEDGELPTMPVEIQASAAVAALEEEWLDLFSRKQGANARLRNLLPVEQARLDELNAIFLKKRRG